MSKEVNQWNRAELMALPVRKWDAFETYDSVLILNTRKKHDSGWGMMAIIGCRDQVPVEIAVPGCDDIDWIPPAMWHQPFGPMRTDCAFRSGGIHAWSRKWKFKVGTALSSTTVELVA